MNLKKIGIISFILIYPLVLIFFLKEKNTYKDANDITLNRESKKCDGGIDVPLSMPCPANSQSSVSQLTGRYVLNSSSSESLSVFSDRSGKIPAVIFDSLGVSHFPFAINSRIFLSDGKKVIEDGKWVGELSGLTANSFYKKTATIDEPQSNIVRTKILTVFCDADSLVIGGGCSQNESLFPLLKSSSVVGPESVGWRCVWNTDGQAISASGEVYCLKK